MALFSAIGGGFVGLLSSVVWHSMMGWSLSEFIMSYLAAGNLAFAALFMAGLTARHRQLQRHSPEGLTTLSVD